MIRNLFESAFAFCFLCWKFCLNFLSLPNEYSTRGCFLRFEMSLDDLDVAPCPCMPGWFLVRCGMPIGGMEAMLTGLNPSGYPCFGGRSAFAVVTSEALGCVIHISCRRAWFGPWSQQGLEKIDHEFSKLDLIIVRPFANS